MVTGYGRRDFPRAGEKLIGYAIFLTRANS